MTAGAIDQVVLGVDVGTSSTKGVLVGLDGRLRATAVRQHAVARPATGHAEMDAEVWWAEFTSISRELLDHAHGSTVAAVGVSGMGPCVTLADADGALLRPAVLYGVDMRATRQIAFLTDQLGHDEVVARCGSALSTQAVGPKLAWLAEHEPDVFAQARRLFMPASLLAYRLTGQYVLDHHSASQCTPMYDTAARQWYEPWAAPLAGPIELPRLCWPGDVAGTITPEAAAETGLPAGLPVIAGTIDAWTESVSVGATGAGDLMLMYGTTLFLVNTLASRATSDVLWGTVGAYPGTYNLAAGMATSGAITSWLRDLVGSPDFPTLLTEAAASGPGARGLLMLPYFAGERTPIADPAARGAVLGLTLDHARGDLYRAALEATAFGVRHNVEAMTAAGGDVRRVVAVGGGTQGGLWTQVVSDITGLPQQIPSVTVGASFGAAFLAASAITDTDIATWNPVREVVTPDPENSDRYAALYDLYRQAYPATRDLTHALVALTS